MMKKRTPEQLAKERKYGRERRTRLGELYNEYYRQYRKGIIIALPKKPPSLTEEERKLRRKEQQRTYARNYRLRNPEKVKARATISYAVKTGELIKADKCERCSSKTRLEAHHTDYSKPLLVSWFCRPCHLEVERP